MPQVAQLALYLDLRRRILSHELTPGERLLTQTFFEATSLSKPATMGVLNALSTSGYLNKHQRSFSVVTWSIENILECTDRLEVFVEICTARALAEEGPRLRKLQDVADKIAEIDPQEEAYFLLFLQWVTILFAAGERRTIPEVAHRLIPQAFYRLVWLLFTSDDRQSKLLGKIVGINHKLLSGSLAGVSKSQKGVFEDLRRGLELIASANPTLRFDPEQLTGRNEVREHDMRGRQLAMSHPYYPLYLPADRSPGTTASVMI